MRVLQFKMIHSSYKNSGQWKEQIARYNLTGKMLKADNIKATVKADCFNIQFKSSKATICKGTDIQAVKEEVAEQFCYITNDLKGYFMDITEYIEFLESFSYITRDSKKNGGKQKIRLKAESKKLIKWLETRISSHIER